MDTGGAESETMDFTSTKRARSAQIAQLTKLYRDLENIMVSYDNIENVKRLFGKLCDRFDQFKSAHLQCLDLCAEPDTQNDLQQSFEDHHTNFVEFQERHSQWMTGRNRPTPEDDECSDVSGVTSASLASSRSKLRTARAKRIIAENKLRRLTEKQKLERAQRELDLKQKLLEQKCELEEASLEESVWLQAVKEDATELADSRAGHMTQGVSNARDHDRKKNEEYKPPKYTPTLQTAVRSKSPIRHDQGKSTNSFHLGNSDVSVTSIDAAFQKLATALQEGFNLPKPELLTFNGTPTEYCKFVKNFEANIETCISDDRLRLSYLIQYCNGEAKSSIDDCVLLEPSDGYKRARSILYSRYGRPYLVARSYIDKLVNGPQLKASDIDGLSKLALEMQKCEITLSQLGFSSDIDNSENLRRIVKRLPMHLRTKWADIAYVISEPDKGTDPGRDPRFSDLAKFVDERSRVANSMYGVDLTKETIPSKHEGASPTKY